MHFPRHAASGYSVWPPHRCLRQGNRMVFQGVTLPKRHIQRPSPSGCRCLYRTAHAVCPDMQQCRGLQTRCTPAHAAYAATWSPPFRSRQGMGFALEGLSSTYSTSCHMAHPLVSPLGPLGHVPLPALRPPCILTLTPIPTASTLPFYTPLTPLVSLPTGRCSSSRFSTSPPPPAADGPPFPPSLS
jgi:hypothetical protein